MTDPSMWISSKVEEVLRHLLENKHLYQSERLSRDAIKAEAISSESGNRESLLASIDSALDADWRALDEISVQQFPRGRIAAETPPLVAFYVDSVKSPCRTCQKVMPFNLINSIELNEKRGLGTSQQPRCQDFVLVYQCQGCRSVPDSFLVRRQADKLTLCGRAPLEFVEVPPYVPKEVRKYYSGAIVAFQSGQVLPALFLLRVLIEQFVCGKLGEEGEDRRDGSLRADEAIEAYGRTLDEDFKRRFPSLKETYGNLSLVIHAADESAEVFEDSLAKIEKHFDARRVYEL